MGRLPDATTIIHQDHLRARARAVGLPEITGDQVDERAGAGAGIGAATGGLIGALTGQGVPEEDAREYEGHVRQGSILLTVHALSADEERQAHEIFTGVSGGSVRSYQAPNAA